MKNNVEKNDIFLKDVDVINKIIDNIISEQKTDWESELGKSSGLDADEASKKVSRSMTSTLQNIRSELSKYKDVGSDSTIEKDKSTVTKDFFVFEKANNNEFKINFDNKVELIDPDNSSNKQELKGLIEFKILGYRTQNLDVVKVKADSGAGNEIFLINFGKTVKDNQPNFGKVWWCTDGSICKKISTSKDWSGLTKGL